MKHEDVLTAFLPFSLFQNVPSRPNGHLAISHILDPFTLFFPSVTVPTSHIRFLLNTCQTQFRGKEFQLITLSITEREDGGY